MSIQVIGEKLRAYACRSQKEEHQALREITQEVMLAALGRTDFFTHALFHGGTCLRIFHGLNRFSEDLDFMLNRPDPDFSLDPYLETIRSECLAYGYQAESASPQSFAKTVHKAMLKDTALIRNLRLHYLGRDSRPAAIKIKIEVDTRPPAGSGHEIRYLDFPFVSMAALQDLPSLFAGKIHSLLCRPYAKGRDWYDFLWYTAQRALINTTFLSAALDQQGPWQGKGLQVDREWCLRELAAKITQLDWPAVAGDVRPFVREHEQPSLRLWNRDLFLEQLKKIG